MKFFRNASIQMDVSKNRSFSIQEVINYTPRTEKGKKIPVCKMLFLGPLGLYPPQYLQFCHEN